MLERDFAGLKDVVEKLENSIQKLTDISASMEKILAVHENVNSTQKSVNELLFDKLQQERDQNRIEHEKMLSSLEDVSDDLKRDIEELKKMDADRIASVEKKVDSIEKWRWMLIGGGVVIGAIFSTVLGLVKTFFK